MRTDPPKDEGLDLLLQEIAKNLDENQRFIKGLQGDLMNRDLEEDDDGLEAEEFEEL